MKIAFFSNFLNHHQLPIALQWYEMFKDDYTFVATEPVHEERLKLGYKDMNKMYPFVLKTYESEENYKKAEKLAIECDVMIIGSAPEHFIKNRLLQKKLTFKYSERIFKNGYWHAFSPKAIINCYNNYTKYRKKNLFMLCASAYTSADMNLIKAFPNKLYKWGYFPEFVDYNIEELLDKKKQNSITKILWVGRFLNWKNPKKAIDVARYLKKHSYNFKLNMIGIGEEQETIKELIMRYSLNDYVTLLGSMSPKQVRHYMEQANIFLVTSNYNEGWGAVLNEAMNSGCACMASHAIGAVPFLIKNGENGIIYKSWDVNELILSIEKLICDRNYCDKLGENAYYTIKNLWGPHIAAENFIKLAEALLNNKKFKIAEGPCSVAKVVKQRQMYKFCKKNLFK